MASSMHHTATEGREERAAVSWPSAQASPEDVFMIWLLRLPDGTDVAEAARDVIARLDRAAPLAPGPLRLRALLEEAAATRPRAARAARPRPC